MQNKKSIPKQIAGYCIVSIASLLITACQADWYPQPSFGSSINNAITAQTVNKNIPAMVDRENQGMDGPAAKATIDSYQRSFEQTGSPSVYGTGSSSIISPTGSSSSSNLPSIIGR